MLVSFVRTSPTPSVFSALRTEPPCVFVCVCIVRVLPVRIPSVRSAVTVKTSPKPAACLRTPFYTLPLLLTSPPRFSARGRQSTQGWERLHTRADPNEQNHHVFMFIKLIPAGSFTRIRVTHQDPGPSSGFLHFDSAADPCLYIPRFAHMLEFGVKTHEVSMTALRLVQRMKRDWMHTGRRPSGLCGAALLVAARMHKFRRSVKDVISVVKVCQTTLRKRLTEFEDTPTSQLTIDEFMRVDLEQECDPPSFTAGQHKAKMQQLEQELSRKLDEVEGEISCYKDEIEIELEKSQPKLRGIYAAYTKEIAPEEEEEEVLPSPSEPDEAEKEMAELQAATQHLTQDFLSQVIQEEQGLGKKPDDGIGDQRVEPEMEGVRPPHQINPLTAILGKLPSAATLGLQETFQPFEGSENGGKADDDLSQSGELDLEGIDDQEIDKYILNDNEVEVKTELWMRENEEYLREQKEKEERINKEKEEGTYKEKKKKKYRKREQIEASTAGEAIEKMLEKKKISSKINYDVLRDLNRGAGSASTSTSDPPDATATRKRLNRRRRRKTSEANQDLAANTTIMGKRFRHLISSPPKKKKTSVQVKNTVTMTTETATESAAETPPDPVPETVSASQEAPPPAEDEEEEEEVEVEEECVSALQLVGDYGCEAEEEEVF
ncbi:transcription factor IIIB 90 kDa subunit-like isoform X3 [Melanotaenia boesemani]|uniref:transcription factor IIIB 90 kDa subunit-like isoform X3 n=1 Tax=Melanotaenia boesemani TaxID=1250792 RepID=UPI001C03CAEF|nr:transcription factor IIIB 90 kDa subunit-like isoform X3 [Melanotaenia boesemani]